jgi:hypothetical protein
VPDELSTTLRDYSVCYEETNRQAIEVGSIVAQMLEQFTGPDLDFTAWRPRTQNGPGGGPTAG